MGGLVKKIHGLPEEARKLLAALCMLIAAVAFFGVWTSFVSSRLTALSPSPGTSLADASQTPPYTADAGASAYPTAAPEMAFTASQSVTPRETASPDTLSPAGGIADTMRGLQTAVSGAIGAMQKQMPARPAPSQGFFASLVLRAQEITESVGAVSGRIADFLYQKLAPYVPPNL